jgi:hypothetical protein
MYAEMFVQATRREDIVTCLEIGDYRLTHRHLLLSTENHATIFLQFATF